jgi:hypothetical protein
MRKIFMAFCFVLVSGVSLRAQENSVSEPNTLTAFLMGGYVRNLSSFPTPIEGINQNGLDVSLRLLCRPMHLLSGGIEIGQSHIYSVDQTVSYEQDTSELHTTMTVMPLIFVFSMSPVENLNINLGTGTSFVSAEATSFGNTATSSTLSPAFMFSVNYIYPLSDQFGIGGECKYLFVGKYTDSNLSFLVNLAYKFLEW